VSVKRTNTGQWLPGKPTLSSRLAAVGGVSICCRCMITFKCTRGVTNSLYYCRHKPIVLEMGCTNAIVN